MTGPETDNAMPEGDDLAAAEYVLGVLSAPERALFATRMKRERALGQLVEQWQARLSPMDSAYPEVVPPESVRQAIDRRLFAETASPAPARPSLWSNLAFWRTAAFAALAALAAAVIIPGAISPPQTGTDGELVAALDAAGSPVRYIVLAGPGAKTLKLNHVAGAREGDHDFELWVIAGDKPPVSIGVIPVGQSVAIPLAAAHSAMITSGAKLAISDEPHGGSPTGSPTGPVLALGEIRGI